MEHTGRQEIVLLGGQGGRVWEQVVDDYVTATSLPPSSFMMAYSVRKKGLEDHIMLIST